MLTTQTDVHKKTTLLLHIQAVDNVYVHLEAMYIAVLCHMYMYTHIIIAYRESQIEHFKVPPSSVQVLLSNQSDLGETGLK